MIWKSRSEPKETGSVEKQIYWKHIIIESDNESMFLLECRG